MTKITKQKIKLPISEMVGVASEAELNVVGDGNMKTYLVRTEAKEHPEQWSTPTYKMEANNIEEIVEKIKNDGRGLNIISIRESKEDMMTSKNKKIDLCLKSLKRVNLKKDDVIILNLKNTNEPNVAVKRMTGQLKEIFPDNKIVVLCNGVDLSVVRKED